MIEQELLSSRMEVIQNITYVGDVQASHMAVYLTLLFASIPLAYVAGDKLSRPQIGLATFIFIAARVRKIAGIAMPTQAVINLQIELSTINPEGIQAAQEETPILYAIWWPWTTYR